MIDGGFASVWVTAGLGVGCEWDASGCINPPSILTLYASPVKSYGGGGRGGLFYGAEPPFGLSNVVARRWGAEPPAQPPFGLSNVVATLCSHRSAFAEQYPAVGGRNPPY